MNNLLDDTKNIVFNFLEDKYKEYLKNNEILLIKEENMKNIITNFYENNSKELKEEIRKKLKIKYLDSYQSMAVENIILDIFQDKELNINRVTDEFIIFQNKHKYKLNLPIINNSLNLNISIVEKFIVINSNNLENINNLNEINEINEIYEIINYYKFLYSIDDVILEEIDNNEKVNIIKQKIENKNEINIELYYLKE